MPSQVALATAVRRYKSEHNLALGSEIKRVQWAAETPEERQWLLDASDDLKSITRALHIEVVSEPPGIFIEA
jgi:hypothetical protein